MRKVTATKGFRVKALATACGALVCMALAGPSSAFVSALPPALNINSHNLFLGQTAAGPTYSTITNIDTWDTFGYAMSVQNLDNTFTDYIVQRVGLFNTSGGVAVPTGFSIGVLAVIDGEFTGVVGTQLQYKFTAIPSFQIFLQNSGAGGGTVTSSFDINTMANLATGFNVLDGAGLANIINPSTCTECVPNSQMNGGYGSTNLLDYTGVFNVSNGLTAGADFLVPDGGTGTPFMQANNSTLPSQPDPSAGQSIFDYLAGLADPRSLVQMSRGAQGEPGEDVRTLVDDGDTITDADQIAAAALFYDLFNGLGLWKSTLKPSDEGYEFAFFTTGADPTTDFAAQVPEPGTLVLLGAALVGLAGVRRRRYGA